jgi:hypothetical protein
VVFLVATCHAALLDSYRYHEWYRDNSTTNDTKPMKRGWLEIVEHYPDNGPNNR